MKKKNKRENDQLCLDRFKNIQPIRWSICCYGWNVVPSFHSENEAVSGK